MKTERGYRLLIRMYSPDFRKRHCDEMIDAMVEESRDRRFGARVAADADLLRNGFVQRVGNVFANDMTVGARWAGTVSLVICIGWSIASLARAVYWVEWRPWDPWAALLWAAVQCSALGQLLLPKAWARRAWGGGLLAVLIALGYGTMISFSVQRGPVPPGADNERWMVAGIGALVALGWFAAGTGRVVRAIALGAGMALGIVLVLRVDAVASPLLQAESRRWLATHGYDHIDLFQIGLSRDVRSWLIGAITLLALIGWFRPKVAAVAILMSIPIAILAVSAHIGAPHTVIAPFAIALFIVIQGVTALFVNWRLSTRTVMRSPGS